jgi:hypothetical protein
MTELLKYTYLLDVKGVRRSIELLWSKYQKILDNKKSSWEDLNEARAILYFIGYLYPEKIALQSLASRIKHVKPGISLDRFLRATDRNDRIVLGKYKNNDNFNKLKEIYLAVKDIKNRVKNNAYLDEERFNRLYSKLKPKDYF